jgi:hypothetical protein
MLPRTLRTLTLSLSGVLSDNQLKLTIEVVRHKLFASFLAQLPALCPTLWVVDISFNIRRPVIGFLRLRFECTRVWSGARVEWVVKESTARLPDRHFCVVDGAEMDKLS